MGYIAAISGTESSSVTLYKSLYLSIGLPVSVIFFKMNRHFIAETLQYFFAISKCTDACR